MDRVKNEKKTIRAGMSNLGGGAYSSNMAFNLTFKTISGSAAN
jgi:hypothetical protein